MRPLTARQQAWLEAFERLTLEADGVPPTVRQLTVHMGLTSVTSAYYTLALLEARGYLRSLPGRRGFWPLSYRALYAKEPVRV